MKPPSPRQVEVVAENVGEKGGWIGFIRREIGVAGLYLSYEEDLDGAFVLVHLDADGKRLGEVPLEASDFADRSPICVVPIATNSALVVGLPPDGGFRQNASYDQLIVSLGESLTTTAIRRLEFDVFPEMSHVQLPGGRVGVLAAGRTALWWTVVDPDSSFSVTPWRCPPECTMYRPAVWADDEGRPWMVFTADFRQVQALRYLDGAPADQRTLTRRFGQKQELSNPDVLNGPDGSFVVYHRNNGLRKRETRDLCLEAAWWTDAPAAPTRLVEDREVIRWATAQCAVESLVIWEHGVSQRHRVVRSATLASPTRISAPRSLDTRFPDFIIPHERHVVLLSRDGVSLTTLAVDLER